MANTITIQATADGRHCSSIYDATYLTTRNATSSNVGLGGIGAGQRLLGDRYYVFRSLMDFEIEGLPDEVIIISAKLRLYSYSDSSDTEFDITIVDGEFVTPHDNSDYDRFNSTSYGTLNTTAWTDAAWNEINFNAAGVAWLQAEANGLLSVGVRSSREMSSTEPTGNEHVLADHSLHSNVPELVITYSDFTAAIYPDPISFPTPGKLTLGVYGVIKDYLESLDIDISAIADGNGNIDLAVTKWIFWTGTGEKIAYDNTNSRVTVTTLESTSSITLVADLVTADLTITTTGAAVDSTVANDALLSDTAYASIKSKITDNEVVITGGSSPVQDDHTGALYLEDSSGDLRMRIKDADAGGTKNAILVDFSAI